MKTHAEKRAESQKRYYDSHREDRIAAAKAWNKANQEHVTRQQRKRRCVTRWMAYLVQHARGTSRSRGREFSLTVADIERLFAEQNGRCYWLGIPLLTSETERHPQRPTIDRLDASRGYTPDNVVLACMFANLGRSTVDAPTFRAFLEANQLAAATRSG